MAEPLKQLDLFGTEATTPVHIAAPKQAKSIKQKNHCLNTVSLLTKMNQSLVKQP